MQHNLSVRPLVLALLACASTASQAVSFTHNDVTLDINGTVNGYYVFRNAESTNLARQAQMLAAQSVNDMTLLQTGTYYQPTPAP